ncbi:hypothetical protein C8Q77DRAFT_911526 [Trametes polyzona]|nr:hypothetical protein C8Q77DRAFT_911526 [Trametes polyzona]
MPCFVLCVMSLRRALDAFVEEKYIAIAIAFETTKPTARTYAHVRRPRHRTKLGVAASLLRTCLLRISTRVRHTERSKLVVVFVVRQTSVVSCGSSGACADR